MAADQGTEGISDLQFQAAVGQGEQATVKMEERGLTGLKHKAGSERAEEISCGDKWGFLKWEMPKEEKAEEPSDILLMAVALGGKAHEQ